jgi:Holliday junction resolvasome RuvABC endonuclease subunit
MLVVGVDCSSKNIAFTLMDENKKIVKNFYTDSNLKDMDSRLEELVSKFETFNRNEIGTLGVMPDENKIKFWVVENPVYLTNPKASSGIAQVIGYVKSVAARHSIQVMGVDNTVWKKGVLGNGHADKDMIFKFAKSNWNEQITNQDLADSACVALWALLRKV